MIHLELYRTSAAFKKEWRWPKGNVAWWPLRVANLLP